MRSPEEDEDVRGVRLGEVGKQVECGDDAVVLEDVFCGARHGHSEQ